jgi:hypothetical protein
MKWLCGLLAFAASLLVGLGLFAILYCPPGQFSYCNYKKVQVGMTLDEVEALLGPGTEISLDDLAGVVRPKPGVVVPKDPPGGPYTTVRNYPVEIVPEVDGDRFFRWELDPSDPEAAYIVVGFRDGKVRDKRYRETSL